jgi:hypothetical protein
MKYKYYLRDTTSLRKLEKTSFSPIPVFCKSEIECKKTTLQNFLAGAPTCVTGCQLRSAVFSLTFEGWLSVGAAGPHPTPC